MTFWKITDNRMNCLITHQEMKDLGYELTDLTQNQERTQEFLDMLLRKGEEVLGINIENGIQNFYGAFLPDKSLLLSISCADIEEEVGETSQTHKDVRTPLLSLKGDEDSPVLSYQVLFPSLDQTISFCGIFGADRAVQSRLYENEDIYYLMMDFKNTEAGRNSAARIASAEEFGGIVETDAVSEVFLKEHEKCIIEDCAVEKLYNFSQ